TISVSAVNSCGSSSPRTMNVVVTPTVGTPSTPSGTLTRCQGSGTSVYTTSATTATNYSWSITGAGNSITPTTATGSTTVTWAAGFSGTATITVVSNGCNSTSAPVSVDITVTPTVGTPTTPSGTTVRCQGVGTSVYTTSATDATGYNWSVSGTGNTINPSGNSATVTWVAGYSGTATVSVTANGCN